MQENKEQPLDNYKKALEIVEAHLNVIMSRPLNETLDELSEFEQAKLKTTLSYAVTTLSLCYLKSKGTDPSEHQNMQHLQRLKSFFTKIDKYVDMPQLLE